jgi:hypothetical protein
MNQRPNVRDALTWLTKGFLKVLSMDERYVADIVENLSLGVRRSLSVYVEGETCYQFTIKCPVYIFAYLFCREPATLTFDPCKCTQLLHDHVDDSYVDTFVVECHRRDLERLLGPHWFFREYPSRKGNNSTDLAYVTQDEPVYVLCRVVRLRVKKAEHPDELWEASYVTLRYKRGMNG